MNNIWYKAFLFSLLLMLIFAPFAGFAPLLLIILMAGTYWFIAPIVSVLIFGESQNSEKDI
ncbi:MAG: hypothetical protein SWZ49_33240 [Cyanobacteriota bacterium]|nr:hypothetical protein [Cyanobacteriota bacterium]